MGPNCKRLLALKMAKDAIPAGGGLEDGIRFLTSKTSLVQGAKAAAQWCSDAIKAIRTAAEPNPFKHKSDEEIAGYLLQQIAQRDKIQGH